MPLTDNNEEDLSSCCCTGDNDGSNLYIYIFPAANTSVLVNRATFNYVICGQYLYFAMKSITSTLTSTIISEKSLWSISSVIYPRIGQPSFIISHGNKHWSDNLLSQSPYCKSRNFRLFAVPVKLRSQQSVNTTYSSAIWPSLLTHRWKVVHLKDSETFSWPANFSIASDQFQICCQVGTRHYRCYLFYFIFCWSDLQHCNLSDCWKALNEGVWNSGNAPPVYFSFTDHSLLL